MFKGLVPKKLLRYNTSGFTIPKATSTVVTTESIANTFHINFVCDLCSCDCAIWMLINELNEVEECEYKYPD